MKALCRLFWIACIVAVLAPSAAFAAAAQEKTGQKAVVKYWSHSGPSILDIEKAKLKEWEAGHPNIQVEVTANGAQHQNVTNLAFQNDQAPDLYRAFMADRTWVELGRMADLGKLLSPAFLKLYEPYYVDRLQRFNGILYAQPITAWNFRFIVNRDVFKAAGLDPKAPPKTYAEVISYAKKITEWGKTQNPPVYGFCLPIKEGWIFEQYVDQMGYANGLNKFNWKTFQYEYGNQKPVLDMYLSMQNDGSLFPGGLTLENDPARAQFSKGVIGMMTGGSWDVGVWNTQFPTKVDWAAVAYPTPDGKIKGKTWRPTRADLAINPKSKVLKQSAQVLEYLSSIELLAQELEAGVALPLHPDAVKAVKKAPAGYGWDGFLNLEQDSPYPPEFTGLPLEGDDRPTTYQTIMAGKAKVDTALADLDKRSNAALQKLIDKGVANPAKDKIPNYEPMNPLAK